VTRQYLLDASALLAIILNESGSDRVQEVFDNSRIHAINLAEVAKKLFQKGMPAEEVHEVLLALELEVIEDVNPRHAIFIGELLAANRRTGLALGDVVCLTTAALMGNKAVTADRRWAECSWPDMEQRDLKLPRPEVLQIRVASQT
jgi:PIN domain nuclease of toxin-antitoxin system